ncbi:amidase [Cupriavidus basilensis]|uniref:amidase n=1 Tax=Cupriavidus basilensis TaxID=68895 RepID=UPI0023E8091E|nr:amidase [Cupriavidus basilensis]MDF3881900.1 amidase [Cupriavidus basilensis]
MPTSRRKLLQATNAAAAATFIGERAWATTLPPSQENIVEASVADLQSALISGKTTSQALVRAYLARIEAYDKNGPAVNAIIEANPDALTIAIDRDKERRDGKSRGPMHGIPILLKDNIATADKMQTTAGSLALLDARPPRDAFIVSRLRDAGAVILGKTNLTEWANFRSPRATSGWSSRGGLTKNPYALDRNTSGSSAGSAAAVAASFATVAVGTETDGSIISPSSINGIVGLKPTLGLVSRDGIVPIAHSQDTAGPMARTVADAAALLSVLCASDARDPATHEATSNARDYTRFLTLDGLRGKRLGVLRNHFGGRNDLVSAVIEQALEVLKAQGATLVDLAGLPNEASFGRSEFNVLLYEFKAGLAAYLAEFAPTSPHKTLADIVEFNKLHADRVMPYFKQEIMVRALAKGGLDSKEYIDALANGRKLTREEGIDKALKENNVDALIAPSASPAWLTDFIRGDFAGSGFSAAAAVAGYPHITVPAGFVSGLPCGLSFVGTAWSEPHLIAMAYAFEQASKARRAPAFARSVGIPGPTSL